MIQNLEGFIWLAGSGTRPHYCLVGGAYLREGLQTFRHLLEMRFQLLATLLGKLCHDPTISRQSLLLLQVPGEMDTGTQPGYE